MDYGKNLISIVIPTHNRQDLIERAVRSAQNQSYPNIEIIVVSDGSTDSTAELMKRICENDARVRFIEYHPGYGGNYARNTGIKASKGEWVAFLDDDDEWHADKLDKQMKLAMTDSELGLICTGINAVYDADGSSYIYIPRPSKDASREILLKNCIGSTTTVMMKHSVLDEIGMFDEKLMAMQDYDLWIRACQQTRIGVVSEPCVEYHNLVGNGQISWNYKKYADATEYIKNKYSELYEKNLSKGEIKQVYANRAFNIARKAIKMNNGSVARTYIRESLAYKFQIVVLFSWFCSFFPYSLINKVYILLTRRSK